MPEGPSIVILKEQAAAFAGKKILAVEGNTSIAKRTEPIDRYRSEKISAIATGTTISSLVRARCMFSNCPPHSMRYRPGGNFTC